MTFRDALEIVALGLLVAAIGVAWGAAPALAAAGAGAMWLAHTWELEHPISVPWRQLLWWRKPKAET